MKLGSPENTRDRKHDSHRQPDDCHNTYHSARSPSKKLAAKHDSETTGNSCQRKTTLLTRHGVSQRKLFRHGKISDPTPISPFPMQSRLPRANERSLAAPRRQNELPEELQQLLITASQTPPVTLDTLSELDLSRIISNISLRMDINYDRNLCFRPNLDGERGWSKRQAAERYWRAIILELKMWLGNHDKRQSSLGNLKLNTIVFQPRLPKLLETLKTVLKSLVPESDQLAVDEQLDVPFIMQQISEGVFDLERLSLWLAALIKTHCAPKRDQMVDDMVKKIGAGKNGLDVETLVVGLKYLFGVLEAMKLV